MLASIPKVESFITIVRVMYDFFRRVPHPHSLAYVARTLFLIPHTNLLAGKTIFHQMAVE
jgi:hypothetical protein